MYYIFKWQLFVSKFVGVLCSIFSIILMNQSDKMYNYNISIFSYFFTYLIIYFVSKNFGIIFFIVSNKIVVNRTKK
jgi:hypothetical protein